MTMLLIAHSQVSAAPPELMDSPPRESGSKLSGEILVLESELGIPAMGSKPKAETFVEIEKLSPLPEEEGATERIFVVSGTKVADSVDENMTWYYKGWDALLQKDWEKATQHFSRFLKDDPDHVYADRAELNLVESYFQSQEYSLVIAMLARFETKYGHSLIQPAASLLRGKALAALGHKQSAKDVFERLIAEFPKSEQATLAKSQIQALSRLH